MCGIVGLYLKNSELQIQLGKFFKPMLFEMSSRGAGFSWSSYRQESLKIRADNIFIGLQ